MVSSKALCCAVLFAAALPAQAQKARRKAPVSPPPVVKTVVETVYVRERVEVPTSNRSQLRPYAKAIGLHASLYAAEVLGSSPYGYLTYDLYPLPLHAFFVQFAGGIGFAQSEFSSDVIGADRFDPNLLIALEVLAGFNLGAPKNTAGIPGGLFPYWVAGIAGLYQGDEANVGAVVGFGQRIAFPWGKGMDRWALCYGVRDQIYSQKIRESSLTQNLIVHLGLSRYY